VLFQTFTIIPMDLSQPPTNITTEDWDATPTAVRSLVYSLLQDTVDVKNQNGREKSKRDQELPFQDFSDVRNSVKMFTIWLIVLLPDTIYLCFWLFLQWGISFISDFMDPSGLDWLQFSIFQILFMTSTLVPILIWIVTDIRKLIIRSNNIVLQERKKLVESKALNTKTEEAIHE